MSHQENYDEVNCEVDCLVIGLEYPGSLLQHAENTALTGGYWNATGKPLTQYK